MFMYMYMWHVELLLTCMVCIDDEQVYHIEIAKPLVEQLLTYEVGETPATTVWLFGRAVSGFSFSLVSIVHRCRNQAWVKMRAMWRGVIVTRWMVHGRTPVILNECLVATKKTVRYAYM
jgi:hypothetical protein